MSTVEILEHVLDWFNATPIKEMAEIERAMGNKPFPVNEVVIAISQEKNMLVCDVQKESINRVKEK